MKGWHLRMKGWRLRMKGWHLRMKGWQVLVSKQPLCGKKWDFCPFWRSLSVVGSENQTCRTALLCQKNAALS